MDNIKPISEAPAGEFVMFASVDGKVRIECRFENETLWLSQAMICDLYGKAKATISGHIKNVFEEGELSEDSVVRFYRTTATDGKSYEVAHYNLEVVLARIRAELADKEITASRKRIARLMHENHLYGVSRRRGWCVTTERNPRQRPVPDLVERQFVASDINQLWVADITYVPTW